MENLNNIFSKSLNKPLVMGILNVTPDSFSDGGDHFSIDSACRKAEKLIQDGADIIDVGGESTRPGSSPVSIKEELNRVVPVIKEISASYDILISVDTRKAEVAAAAADAGADIINDVSGFSNEMLEFLSYSDMPAVLMHSLWDPEIMQSEVSNSTYGDVVADITSWFEKRIAYAESFGVKKGNLILDPGIGFGKLLDHNLEIIKRCDEFNSLGLPVLIGASRKSFIGSITGKSPKDRIAGSLAVAAYVYGKAKIVRVHDVQETADLFRVMSAICSLK